MRYFPSNVERQAIRLDTLDAEWLHPVNAESGRVIVFLHGGFTIATLLDGRNLAAWIALACQSPVLNLDYRLAPEYPFPAALEDSITAYRWLLETGNSPKQIALVGESAGGNLVLSTGLALRDAGDPLPGAIVALSPLTDLTLTARFFNSRIKRDPMLAPEWVQPHIAYYLGQVDSRTPLASPFFADLHGLPPLLIQVGEHEIFVEDVVGFVEKAKGASVETILQIEPGMWHVYQKFAMLPESRRAIDRIGRFVRQKFGPTNE